jgi:hypothetical protein
VYWPWPREIFNFPKWWVCSGNILSDIHSKFDFPEHKVKATAGIKVEIESTTGKQAGF